MNNLCFPLLTMEYANHQRCGRARGKLEFLLDDHLFPQRHSENNAEKAYPNGPNNEPPKTDVDRSNAVCILSHELFQSNDNADEATAEGHCANASRYGLHQHILDR